MTSILKPFANILNPIKMMPMGNITVDKTHSIAKELFDCVVWNNELPINIAPSSPQTITRIGNPTSQMTAIGPAGYATGGTGYSIPYHGNLFTPGGGDYAIRVIFSPVSWPGGFTLLFDVAARELSLFFNTSGNLSFYGIGEATSNASGTTGLSPNSVWDLVMTRNNAVNSRSNDVYVNGKYISTISTVASNPSTWGANDSLSFGPNTSGGGTSSDIKYISAQTWSRFLDPSEISFLYLNPFDFIIPDEYELPIIASGITPPPAAQIYSFDQVGAHITRKITSLGY